MEESDGLIALHYTCKKDDSSFFNRTTGKFMDYETQFLVETKAYDQDPNFESHKLQWDYPHNNYLRCIAVDQYKKAIFYTMFDTTFSLALLKLEEDGIFPLMEFTIPLPPQEVQEGGELVQVEAKKETTVRYVPDIIKKYIRGLTRYIIHIHSKNLFTSRGFTIDNVAVKDEDAQFYGLSLKRETREEKKRESAKKDFKELHDLIRKLFGKNFQYAPKDFRRFMRLLLAPKSYLADMMPDHVALLSHDQRASFVQNVTQRNNRGTKLYIEAAFHEMKDRSGWKASVMPHFGPIKAVLEYKPLEDSNTGLHGVSVLFRFMRNVIVHIKDNQADYATTTLDNKFADPVLMYMFHEQICDLQEHMHEIDVKGKTLLSMMLS